MTALHLSGNFGMPLPTVRHQQNNNAAEGGANTHTQAADYTCWIYSVQGKSDI